MHTAQQRSRLSTPLTKAMNGLIYTLILANLVVAQQTCDNYGTINSTTSKCDCPTGFGGDTCSQPGCGGTIFEGDQRPLAPPSLGQQSSNLTSSGCECADGWGGVGCNVCQKFDSCAIAWSDLHANSSTSAGAVPVPGTSDGLNHTLTCNTSPRVFVASQMSCQVNNPTLQALFPLQSTLNIMRTLHSSLTPIPNVTAFGTDASVYAQLIYAGVEQFFCTADTCSQSFQNDTGATDWHCGNLKCTCRPGTTFCGGVPLTDITGAIDSLANTLDIDCGISNTTTGEASCQFKQDTLVALFGAGGMVLDGCIFGECVAQGIVDSNGNVTDTVNDNDGGGSSLSAGVIAGLAVVGALVGLALLFLLLGLKRQRDERNKKYDEPAGTRLGIIWDHVSYVIPGSKPGIWGGIVNLMNGGLEEGDKTILDNVSGGLRAGQMMAILGPSGAGKTTLIELLAGKSKSGIFTGSISFHSEGINPPTSPHIGFVPQQDILPPMLTVYEALLFAARLRLPETIPYAEKRRRVLDMMEKLGISHLTNVRIGHHGEASGGKKRGISGGEMRRVSIGLELIARPDVLILDEPTSGLDSVSASRVAKVLQDIAQDPVNPIPIIASIHQPSSQLYQIFDSIMLLSHGRALYCGPGSSAPARYFSTFNSDVVPPCPQGYNIADYLLEVATDPPVQLFSTSYLSATDVGEGDALANVVIGVNNSSSEVAEKSKGGWKKGGVMGELLHGRSEYAATFLTQLECLSGREWKILQRDFTLFFTHIGVSSVLGVFCGGLYFQTDDTIAGFQSRVGCLFFLGALIAFSTLSALYNVVDTRPLFLRERSSSYYSPTAWLMSRFFFDAIPLRIMPSIIVATITYWMAGLTHDAAHFFKFLLIIVLYTLVMTLFNFLLGALFSNGGVAILLSALTALYQMTYAGFFVHLDSIPPAIRWLQWLCPLKYCLEALSVNEVDAGSTINDSLEGVPVSVSTTLIMNLLFGFGTDNYYRDILVLFAFIAGFAACVIVVVWFKLRERR